MLCSYSKVLTSERGCGRLKTPRLMNARARAVEEMTQVLAEDPVFSALFDKAAGGSG